MVHNLSSARTLSIVLRLPGLSDRVRIQRSARKSRGASESAQPLVKTKGAKAGSVSHTDPASRIGPRFDTLSKGGNSDADLAQRTGRGPDRGARGSRPS